MATSSTHKLSVLRLSVSGGVTAAVIFILCWIGTAIPFSSPTHGYIGLFTPEDVRSTGALLEGTLWSLLFGALTGGLFGFVYNLFSRLDR